MHRLENLHLLVLDENAEIALVINGSDVDLTIPDGAQHRQLGLAKGTCNHPDALEDAGLDSVEFDGLEIHM